MGDLQYSGSGILYIDATNYFGETPEPWKLTFEGGYCTAIDGGREGELAWEMYVDKYRNANRLREYAINIHPKATGRFPKFDPSAPVPAGALPRSSLGDFLIALGGDTGVGGVDPGYEHAIVLFGQRRDTTVTADGDLIVDRGRVLILNDPDLRAIALGYGDPDDLLAPATDELESQRVSS